MKEIRINQLHRYVGIVIAPFLVIQTVSGLLLGLGLFRQPAAAAGDSGLPISRGVWDRLLVKIHFEPGWFADAYHLLLGVAIIWMAVSGWILYLRARSRRENLIAQHPAPPGGKDTGDRQLPRR